MAKSTNTARQVKETTEAAAPEQKGKAGKAKAETRKPTAEQQKKLDACKTVSEKIRYLDSEGFTRGDIAKCLNKRYQHVRNVLETPLKRK